MLIKTRNLYNINKINLIKIYKIQGSKTFDAIKKLYFTLIYHHSITTFNIDTEN